MTRPVVLAPLFDGRRMLDGVLDNDMAGGDWSRWQILVAPGIRLFVDWNRERAFSRWRVAGIGPLYRWSRVEGGPRMAATAATRALRQLADVLKGYAA